MKIIETKAITKSYQIGQKTKKVLSEINFILEKGEFIAIVGESGSGKSTFAKVLLDLTKADSGEILFHNQPAETIKDRHIFIQTVLQNPYSAFDPLQTVAKSLKNVIVSNHLISDKSQADQFIQTELKKYGLTGIDVNKKARHFSGGQLQLLGILRAMLIKPEVLLADEVISALDNELKLEILDLLKNLQKKEELSILFITHNIGSIQNYADKIIVFKEGQIVESGTTNRILFNADNQYTKKLIAALPTIKYYHCRNCSQDIHLHKSYRN